MFARGIVEGESQDVDVMEVHWAEGAELPTYALVGAPSRTHAASSSVRVLDVLFFHSATWDGVSMAQRQCEDSSDAGLEHTVMILQPLLELST